MYTRVLRTRYRRLAKSRSREIWETFAMSAAVKGIKRQHLVEIRSMANPPAIVKLALESICLLLEENAKDWKQIRAVIMKDSFIPTIVNFNTEDIT